ncbi:MAG: hypothetical protein IJA89_04560 [Clostridia bacterium]|nr:hypothetical protein [Clostridia bacterium]
MKRMTKKILTFTCGVCAAVCIAVSGVQFANVTPSASAATAENITFSQALEEQYALGEIFTAPSATITFQGKTYAADERATVYYPDGSVMNGTRFTLGLAGTYTIVYETTVAGVRVTAEKTFDVLESSYTLPNSCSYTYSERVKTQNPEQFVGGGLNVQLAMGAEFVYNKPVDISSASLDTPVITFAPYQYSNYMLDANGRPVVQADEFFVRITDAYDENNYIELYMLNRSKDLSTHETGKRGYPYMSVGAAGQTKFALDVTSRYQPSFNNGKIVNVDGGDYCAVYENFGVNHGLIPWGEATNGEQGNDLQGGYFSVYYEAATKRVYVSAPIRNGNDPAILYQRFLNDLDNENIYPSGGFKGFTTGEVYISVRADSYLADKMQFEVLEVYGEKGEDFAKLQVQDTRAPLLQFDTVDETQTFLTEKDATVKLPTATAYDVHLQGDVETRVYYAYGTENQELINSDNGAFTPTKTGAYTVEYIAKDGYGNQTVKTLLFSCLDGETLTFDVEKLESGFAAGSSVTLPAHEIVSLNGWTDVDVYATFAGQKIEIDESTLTFFVDYVGEYTITYEYGDILTKESYSYTVSSVASNNIVFGAFNLPKYFIKGAYYTLDTVYAYTYQKTEPVANQTEVAVKEDGAAEFKKISFEEYRVKASESVQFQYSFGGLTAVSEALPVVDVDFTGKIDMSKYLVGDVAATAEKKYILVQPNAVVGDTTVEFINPIAFSLFRFAFNVPKGLAAFDGLEIKITDYYDSSVSTVIGFYKNGDMTSFAVGGKAIDLTYSFVDTDFEIWYDSKSGKMMEKSGATMYLGNPFCSDRVFVEFTFKGANGGHAIELVQIGNQPMTNNSRDRYPAAFTYENLFGGLNEINQTITVYAGQATDVLSPYYQENMRVSVIAPDGSFVIATDGTRMEKALAIRTYDFVTSAYGTYLVSYSYFDQNMNEVTGMYYIDVVDMQSPVIELADGYGEKTRVLVDVGDEVEIAEFTVSDNLTAMEDLVVKTFVQYADGRLLQLTESSFTANCKGDYVVYYYCYDTDENYTVAKYYVRAD